MTLTVIKKDDSRIWYGVPGRESSMYYSYKDGNFSFVITNQGCNEFYLWLLVPYDIGEVDEV